MQHVIRELVRVDAGGGDLKTMVKHALRGVSLPPPRLNQDETRAPASRTPRKNSAKKEQSSCAATAQTKMTPPKGRR